MHSAEKKMEVAMQVLEMEQDGIKVTCRSLAERARVSLLFANKILNEIQATGSVEAPLPPNE